MFRIGGLGSSWWSHWGGGGRRGGECSSLTYAGFERGDQREPVDRRWEIVSIKANGNSDIGNVKSPWRQKHRVPPTSPAFKSVAKNVRFSQKHDVLDGLTIELNSVTSSSVWTTYFYSNFIRQSIVPLCLWEIGSWCGASVPTSTLSRRVRW
jgi:hypothetical protein